MLARLVVSTNPAAESRFVVENYHTYDTKPDTTSVKTADKEDEEFRVYDEETSPRVREVREGFLTPLTRPRPLAPASAPTHRPDPICRPVRLVQLPAR